MSALTVSTDEAAELLGCSAQRIRDQVRRGAIPAMMDLQAAEELHGC